MILAPSDGSNSRQSAKVEIHAATDANDSRSEANRKWRSLQRVHQCSGDDPQVSPPALSNPPTPIAPPSNPLRMSSFLSPKFGAQPTHSPGDCQDFSNNLSLPRRYLCQSVLSPVIETTPTLLRSRMGNHPAL